MKQIYTLLVMLLVSVSALAQNSGKALYRKYSDEPGVQAVYISPAMFRLIGRIPDVEIGDSNVNLARVIKSMTGFYLISFEDPELGRELSADVSGLLDRSDYELMMEVKDDGQTVRLYTVSPTDELITSLIMHVRDQEETTFLSIDGEIDRAALEELIASATE